MNMEYNHQNMSFVPCSLGHEFWNFSFIYLRSGFIFLCLIDLDPQMRLNNDMFILIKPFMNCHVSWKWGWLVACEAKLWCIKQIRTPLIFPLENFVFRNDHTFFCKSFNFLVGLSYFWLIIYYHNRPISFIILDMGTTPCIYEINSKLELELHSINSTLKLHTLTIYY